MGNHTSKLKKIIKSGTVITKGDFKNIWLQYCDEESELYISPNKVKKFLRTLAKALKSELDFLFTFFLSKLTPFFRYQLQVEDTELKNSEIITDLETDKRLK